MSYEDQVMSYEDQDPWDGDCPGCREYEQERQRLVQENEDLRIHCAMLDAALTEAETSAANRLAERDAAFKMSRCECGPDECCANLVRLHKEIERLQNALNADSQAFQIECQKAEIERLQVFLRTCVDKMIDYEVDDTHENADFIVDCAAAAGPYPEEAEGV